MSSSSFHMFIYARSEQCNLLPIYTITNTQRIRIYPGKLKSFLVKISPDQDVNMANMPKKSQTLFTFLTAENLSGGSRTKPPGQKPPLPKPPRTKTPETKHSFQKFYNFCF